MSDAVKPDTGSFAVTVNDKLAEFVNVEGFCENDNTGAPDTPSTYRDAAATADAGPVLPAASTTASAANCSTNVPSPHPVTATLIVVPDDAAGVNTHPVAVPVFEKSAAARPLIASPKVTAYVDDADNGPVGTVENVAVGTVRSTVIAVELTVLLGIAVPPPAVQEPAPERIDNTTVPSEPLERETVTV
jgi:hypothetical protein